MCLGPRVKQKRGEFKLSSSFTWRNISKIHLCWDIKVVGCHVWGTSGEQRSEVVSPEMVGRWLIPHLCAKFLLVGGTAESDNHTFFFTNTIQSGIWSGARGKSHAVSAPVPWCKQSREKQRYGATAAISSIKRPPDKFPQLPGKPMDDTETDPKLTIAESWDARGRAKQAGDHRLKSNSGHIPASWQNSNHKIRWILEPRE